MSNVSAIENMDRELLKRCESCNGEGDIETGRFESETGSAVAVVCRDCDGEGLVPDPDKICEVCQKREAINFPDTGGGFCDGCFDSAREDAADNAYDCSVEG